MRRRCDSAAHRPSGRPGLGLRWVRLRPRAAGSPPPRLPTPTTTNRPASPRPRLRRDLPGAPRVSDGSAGGPDVEPCEAADELFWFRWITGHQVCFVVWQLIAQLLDDVDRGRTSPDEALEPISRYVDSYSAMLLYTGSCPQETYRVVIRPSMRRRHPAFSGSWAPDYWPIRGLFRGRQPSIDLEYGHR